MRIFENTNYDFLGKRKMFYAISLAIIVIGFTVLFVTKSIPLGIDFSGGTELQIKFEKEVNIGDLREAMDNAGFAGMELKTMGSERDVLLRTPMQEEGQLVSDKIQQGIKAKIKDNNFEVQRIDKVGPKIGAELRRNALFAVIFSLIAILIYLAFRFQFVFAVGAVIALFHDVLVTIAVIAIFDAIFPNLRLEFNQSMLAAFLTLVGFSSNDTVIVFDRIRENIKLFKNEDILHVMNRSINATLSRTIITSGTVFITVLVLFIFGGEVNRSFAFTFAIGIITGTYSSVFVASAIVVDWKERGNALLREKSLNKLKSVPKVKKINA
ncbi:MAG: protein translocase subunit SecF [Ignavibacteria bacterium]|jgi:preprotein translocase subunit SecF|nr:protein translocase subunit SecF [Ignavibacteria bacterium]MBK7254105.1 protein translocase subunit SecF [Ignavibacteria bacterium]MBK7446916.1 protein translocase subunit SecF [Ignavibacteria bacterium]